MTTIANAVFPEVDEEDEDYVDSGSSTDNDDNDDDSHWSRATKLIRDRKVERVYAEMKEESRKPCSVAPGKKTVLSQFQLPVNQKKLGYVTKGKVKRDVCLLVGQCIDSAEERFDIARHKKKFREDTQFEAIWKSTNNDSKTYKEKIVRFAGKVIKIQQKTQNEGNSKTSKSCNIRGLSDLSGILLEPKIITSVDKSLSDWNSFKEAEGAEKDFRRNRKDGYLGRQAFLEACDIKTHNHRIEVKRRKRA